MKEKKRRVKVLNGLPLGALEENTKGEKTIAVAEEISKTEARHFLRNREVISYIGHEDTAKILSKELGKKIEYNRATTTLKKEDLILICAYIGKRLKEGETRLPEEAGFRYFKVRVYLSPKNK